MYHSKVAIPLVILTFLSVLYIQPVYACLSEQETDFLEFLDWYYLNQTGNTTNSTEIFQRMCEYDLSLNSTKADNSSLSGFYMQESIDNKIAILNWNITQLDPNVTAGDIQDMIEANIGGSMNATMDTEFDKVDDMFNNLKISINSTYMPRSDFDALKSNLTWTMYKLEKKIYDVPSPAWWWLFAIGAVTILGIGLLWKIRPDILDRKSLMKSLPKSESRTHGIEEYTIPGTLTEKVKGIRQLKYCIAKHDGLAMEEKVKLIKDVEDGRIKNQDDLKVEIEILHALSMPKKRKNPRIKGVEDIKKLLDSD